MIVLSPIRVVRALGYRVHLLRINPRLRRQRIKWLSDLTERDESICKQYVEEVEKEKKFLRAVRSLFRRYTRNYIPSPFDFMASETGGSMFFHCVSLYAFVRLTKPEVIVETGGTPGKSSAFILRALERNGGELYTIDLPPEQSESERIEKVSLSHERLPKGLCSGWCVPDWLRSRQHLLLERAEELLSPLLEELGEVNVFFIHDSLHTYEHMTWEFETAWPHIRRGGFLWSDDMNSNKAWRDFCSRHSVQPFNCLSVVAVRKE
jgi:hypothetical protein